MTSQEVVIDRILKTEVRYHLIKLVIIITMGLITIAATGYFANQAVILAVKQNEVIYCVLLLPQSQRNQTSLDQCKFKVNNEIKGAN